MESIPYFVSYFVYGCKDALMGGFLIIAIRLLFCNNTKDTLQTFVRWALIYSITGLLLAMITLVAGLIFLYRIQQYTNWILYCAVSFITLLYVFRQSSKTELFITTNLFLYAIAILQGVHSIDLLANLYAMTTEISTGLLLGCLISFLLGYMPFVMAISVAMSMISQRFAKSRNVLLTLLAVLCLGKVLLPLMDIYIY